MSATYDLGFLGGGQLARMSIQAAQRMGLTCLSLDPTAGGPAAQVADSVVGRLDDPQAIADILRRCRRVTLENEFIPANAIREAFALAGVPETNLVPSVDALETIQDKLRQREAYAKAGVASPKAVALEDNPVGQIGFPMVLKARFGGYDGKGTRYARTPEEFEAHRPLWERGGWLAEQFVPFKREVAVMVSIGENGEGCFPTMHTVQENHVCDLVYPSGADASAVALAAARAVGGKGLFGVELFEDEAGRFSVNEIAPRPHNTGHYTLDWGGVSQFEQHVRIALDLPLGRAEGILVCMANLLGQPGAGDFRRGLAAALKVPGVHVHWYGKAEAKPGRKMGHLNAVGDGCVDRAQAAREAFYRAWVAE
ncbi:MAG: 5-(carboxyamino)imidazole ribonucleotide synthase [Fimbriimonas sp.]